MNNQRRKSLREVTTAVEAARIIAGDLMAKLEEVKEMLESIRDEEQEYLDNIPENLQGSDRYSISESSIESMESAIDSIDNLVESIEDSAFDEINDSIEEAIEA